MYRIQINQQFYDVPSELSEITIDRFLQFRNLPQQDGMHLHAQWAIGTAADFQHGANTEQELSNLFALMQPLYIQIYDWMESKQKTNEPKSIEVFGKSVPLRPGLLSDLPYWPYAVCKAKITKAAKDQNTDFPDMTEHYPVILAHYLYAYCTGKTYDEAEAERFEEIIRDVPMTEAIQLGNFFLIKVFGFPRPRRLGTNTTPKSKRRR